MAHRRKGNDVGRQRTPNGNLKALEQKMTQARYANLQAFRQADVATALRDVELAAGLYVQALALAVIETAEWMGAIPVDALVAYCERYHADVITARRNRHDLEVRYINRFALWKQLHNEDPETPPDALQATESDETLAQDSQAM